MLGSQDLRRQLRALQLPLLIAVVSGVLFTMPDQTREIYRALAESFASLKPTEVLERRLILIEVMMAMLGLLFLAVVIWLAARRAASRYQAASRFGSDESETLDFSQRPLLLTWLPRLLAVTPLSSVALGLYLASVKSTTNTALQTALEPVFVNGYVRILGEELRAKATALGQGNIKELLAFNWYLISAALLIVATAIAAVALISLADRRALAARIYAHDLRPSLVAACATLVAVLASTAAVVVYPVAMPQALGVLFIMSAFLALLLLILTQLQIWGYHFGLPLTAGLVLAAILFSTLDWNDNHTIRASDRPSGDASADMGAKHELKRWLASRGDLEHYKGAQQRYPIYIVAAQGGGIYAAKHAASFLGELQDLCPGFGHHLFAISGVSGGSVGAAIFAVLVQQYDWSRTSGDERYRCVARLEGERQEHFQHATTEVFSQDLWSPLAAGLLFPDFLQRFLPVSIPSWDRARWLDDAIEEAYNRAVRIASFPVADASLRPLSSSFLLHWNPERHSHTPALMFNTTEVGTGRRRIVSPFTFGPVGLDFLPIWSAGERGSQAAKRLDPSLSTAAGLSARFPWITPSAHFYEIDTSDIGKEKKKRKVRLVDGAYFENSGVVTALDVVKEIAGAVRRGEIAQKIEINLLVFTSTDFDAGGGDGLGEALDPIRAMFNSRAARATIAIEEAVAVLKEISTEDGPVKADIVKLELNGYGYPLPLGWRLSPITRHLISLHNGMEADCSDAGAPISGESKFVSASCAKRRIYDRLR